MIAIKNLYQQCLTIGSRGQGILIAAGCLLAMGLVADWQFQMSLAAAALYLAAVLVSSRGSVPHAKLGVTLAATAAAAGGLAFSPAAEGAAERASLIAVLWAAAYWRLSPGLASDRKRLASPADIASISQELSRRIQAESRALEGEETARALLNAIPDAALLLDREGRILEINQAALARLRTTAAQAKGKPLFDLLPDEAAAFRRQQMRRAMQTGQPVRSELEVKGCLLVSTVNPVRDGSGQVTRLATISRDITEERRNIEMLWAKESSLAQAQRIAQLGNWTWDPGQGSADCSAEICRILGLDPERPDITFDRFMDCVHPKERLRVRRAMLASIRRSETFELVHRIVRPDGTIRLVHQLGEVELDARRRPVQWMGTIQDVTELKAAEQSLKVRAEQQAVVASLGQTALLGNEFEELIDEAMRAIRATLDLDYCSVLKYTISDDSFLLRWGSGWDEGMVGQVAVASGADSPARRTLERQTPLIIEDLGSEEGFESAWILHQHRVKSGLSVPVWGAECLFGVLGAYSRSKRSFTQDDCHFMQAVSNILAAARQRQLNEERIQSSLKEKEVLLKELHHRVKNNLQIIQSMLNLQARRSRDPQAVSVLRNSQGRVRSMSLIHEKLYSSKSLNWIPFGDYLRELMRLLAQSQPCGSVVIETDVEADDLELDIETAIPCGLILNELVSNSLRHAFVGRSAGRVEVRLRQVDSDLVVTVADNGKGFVFPSHPAPDGSLGLQLVHALTKQLNGSIEGQIEDGTRIRLQIPFRQPTKRMQIRKKARLSEPRTAAPATLEGNLKILPMPWLRG